MLTRTKRATVSFVCREGKAREIHSRVPGAGVHDLSVRAALRFVIIVPPTAREPRCQPRHKYRVHRYNSWDGGHFGGLIGDPNPGTPKRKRDRGGSQHGVA